ncbi:transcriptional activator srcap [Fusarium coicis]|nr:transcriptional activator srcap [Fusarium coicis]
MQIHPEPVFTDVGDAGSGGAGAGAGAGAGVGAGGIAGGGSGGSLLRVGGVGGPAQRCNTPELDDLALEMMFDDIEELGSNPSAGFSSLTTSPSGLKERKTKLSVQKQLQVAAGKDESVLSPIDGLVASKELLESLNNDLPGKIFTVVDETTVGWDFLAWTGPICFNQSAKIDSESISLGENDTTLEVLQACWKNPDLQDSYVSGIDIHCQRTAGDGLPDVSLDNMRLYIKRSEDQQAHIFSAQKEVLNQKFEREMNPSSRAKMTGFERLPGHLLLGLETGSRMGGFDNLGDFLNLFDMDLGIWLTGLGSGVKVQLTQSSGEFPPRNGFWYLPAQDYTSVLRLCGTLRLEPKASLGKLGEMIVQCLPGLTSQLELPDLNVVFKQTAAPVIEHGNTYIDGTSEVTFWTEFDVGSPKSLGLYFSLFEEVAGKTVEDLGDALLSLEGDLAVLVSNRGSKKDESSPAMATKTEAAEDLDDISFHRLALTVSKDRDLLGASDSFKASMPYLVQKGLHAMFELSLSWNPGLYEFQGTFIPAAIGPDDPALDGYMIDHEVWDSTIPLNPNAAPFMSLRFIDPSTEINIPYGIPSEITQCELYVSNKATRISGHLASAIKPPSPADASKVPILLVDRTELQIEANLDYSSGATQASFDLWGMITLKRSEYATDDPPCVIQAAIGYRSGAWSFSAQATDVPMISLSSIFVEGPERDAAMQMLSQIHLDEIFIDYKYAGASVSKLRLGGSMTIAGVTTSIEYNRSEKPDWRLQATVEKNIVADVLDKKPETLGDTLGRLLGSDVADILPDFVRDITLPDFEPDHDHVQLNCSPSAFGVVLSIGKLHVQMGQLRQEKKDKDQEILPAKRLVIVSLGPLPSTADVPLVGSVSLPFDQLEFVWASENFSNMELTALEVGAGFSTDTTTKIRRSPDEAPLSKGFHFRLVGDKEVWVDHPFTREKKSAPGPGVVGQDQIVAADQKAPPADTGPMKPIKKKRGGLNMSGVGVSFDSENDVLSVHLDADVAIGPISAGVQGLTVKLDLKQLGSLDKLISDASASISKVEKALTVSISGINVFFNRAPILIAGGLEHSKDEEGEMFAGDIATSLTQFSIGAYGMYQKLNAKPPFPAYNSVFVYAMVEGTLFTVGWAEISWPRRRVWIQLDVATAPRRRR